MSKKSKRVASRHAQLSGRQRRTRPHGPSGIPSEDGGPIEATIEETVVEPGAAPRQQAAAPASAPLPRPRGRGRVTPPVDTYFGAEIRHIGIVSGLILAILIVLIFVLQ